MDAMEIRRNAIVELVNKYGTVSFSQIKEQFSNVSEMTLRTDLKALRQRKLSGFMAEPSLYSW